MQTSLKEVIRAQYAERPLRPTSLSLILRDVTPEGIAWHLHTLYPSAGLMSDEGGQIVNGRAADQLPMLNVLWDGGDLKVNRKESESFTVRNARFTVSVMLQSRTFDKFLERKGQLARDNGFLARVLICKPQSMQGQRPISTIEQAKFPKLEVFQSRMSDLLEKTHLRGGDRGVRAKTLEFSPDAKMLWVDFANHIERNLNPGGLYVTARDAASKTAENVARMAALFHHFEGRSGEIQRDSVDQALQICEWYLREFVRIFCPPPPLAQYEADAMTLDAWLRNNFASNGIYMVKRNFLLQCGPASVRSKARLDPAIGVLTHFGKIRLVQEPKTRAWWVELYVQSSPYHP